MNNKTHLWAVRVSNTEFSEAVQRIAFSFGYHWAGEQDQVVKYTSEPVLCFDSVRKTIKYLTQLDNVQNYVCKVCFSLEDVIATFNSPPKVIKTEKVGQFEIDEDGTVLFKGIYHFTSECFNNVIEVRNKLMGKKQKLPVIRFRYHSPTSGLKVRQIALVGEDDVYLNGLDLEDGNKFKQFRKDRLEAGGTIWFGGLKEV